jgi:Zn-dependent protease
MIDVIIRIFVVLFAITIHEYSHGKAALSLGDPTARDAGRLTLNPLPHIDPIGALCLFLLRFGWAKPVPVNVGYFKNPRRDTILMALSGPIANLSAAFVAGLFIRGLWLQWGIYQHILIELLLINLGLGIFNLIPIPPLDGSHVLENSLPPGAAQTYRRFGRYMPFVLLAVILAENFLKINILGKILAPPIIYLACFFGGQNMCAFFGV